MRVPFALRMAARELRATPRRLLLLTGTVAVGVAALVAINSFSNNLRDSVRQQARALLGADLSLVSRQPLSRRVEALLDTLSRRAELARVTSFGAMAYGTRGIGARLVQVSAVAGRYPFYGAIRTEPSRAWSDLQKGRHAIVDPSLLSALNVQLGDTLVLGEARFVITGTIQSAPSEVGFRFALGPKVYIPAAALAETRLLGFGARVQYEVFLRLQGSGSAQELAARYRTPLRAERVTLRTVADDQRNLTDVLSKLTGYLGLVALTALLLAGVGVASAVLVLVRQRIESIAVLRCLGASADQVFATYLLETATLGLVGSVAGALLGMALQRLLPEVLGGLLPIEVVPSLSWSAVGMGVGMGLWVTLIFTVIPLLAVRRISPLEALRRPIESTRSSRDLPWWSTRLVLAASVVLLAINQVGSWRQGAMYAGGVGLTLLILWGAAWALVRALRQRLPAEWPYVWRQGLANLHRPSNQTVTLVLAIGFGAFLLGTLYLVQHNLLQQLRLTGGPARPNLVLFDIQSDQLSGVQREIRAAGLSQTSPTPIVTMRIQSIKGRPVTQLLRGSQPGAEPSSGWALRREYRSTYRDTLVASERVVAGRWSRSQATSPARISVEQDLARELGIGIGDEVVWDVQGVSVPSRVISLRQVEWARFEPNFFVVFAPGTLERAPQTYVTLTRIVDPAERGRFQRRLAESYPNVSILDLSLLQEALERLVTRVTLAIQFMAIFSLGVGTLVLLGALATSRFQRIREMALLRTLGATRAQILRILLAEYLALGLLAAAVALVLATLAGWALARFVFEGSFSLPVPALSALALGIVALTVVVGLANSREVVRRTPLEVLREY